MDVRFTVLNVPALLCASIGSICEFYYADYESCHSHHIVCLIDIYLSLGCVRLNLINHVLALFRDIFTCNTALRNPVFRWESCKGSV